MVLLFFSAISASDMYTFFGEMFLLPTHFSACHEQIQGLTFHVHTDQDIRKHFRWGLKREQIAQISLV